MDSAPDAPLLEALKRDGYVVVPSILTPEQLAELREAAANITELARAGKWPSIRTVGKQFPPWESTPPPEGIWGVQHLLHPELPIPAEQRAAFARLYFSDAVLDVAKQLLQCGDDDLVMELCNMLVTPGAPFELRWHRDDIPWEAGADEELERLDEPAWHAQWNLALHDDDSLVLVPGSHRRARTDAERAAEPFQAELPGLLKVQLRAGDIAFYNNNILHRGVYDTGRERLTPHGSVGHVKGSKLRARNVLQHGIGGWVESCDFGCIPSEEERKRAEGMRERLIKLGRDSGEVGYSLSG